MNIVLQLMILPKIAGVCFTNAIDLNGQDVVYIEYVEGIGESLVSGKKTAKSVVVSLKDYSYRCEENSDKELFKDMIKYLKLIKDQTSEELDLEWCIDSNGKSFFLQARPITRQVIIREKMSTGAIASPGNCSGEIYVIDEDGLQAMCKEFPGIELFKICVSARESTRLYRGVSQERIDRDKQRKLLPLAFYDAVIFNNGSLRELFDEVQRVRYMIV